MNFVVLEILNIKLEVCQVLENRKKFSKCWKLPFWWKTITKPSVTFWWVFPLIKIKIKKKLLKIFENLNTKGKIVQYDLKSKTTISISYNLIW